MSIFLKLMFTIVAIAVDILGYAALRETISAEPFSPRGSTIIAMLVPALAAIWAFNVPLLRRLVAWAGGLILAAITLWIADVTSLQSLTWLSKVFQGSSWLSVLVVYPMLPPAIASLIGWFLTREILKTDAQKSRLKHG